ncbi:uncharacterized protein ACRADG_010548 [Cochliomyia hominivorax]
MLFFSSTIHMVVFLGLIVESLQFYIKINETTCTGISAELTQDCCRLKNIYSENVKEKCKRFIKNTNPDENYFMLGLTEEHYCYTNCALNEMNILDNGVLNKENLLLYVNEALHDTPQMISVAEESFTGCFGDMEDAKNDLLPTPKGFCSLKGILIMNCVYMRTYKYCTGPAWSNTKECNDQRDFISNCLPPYVFW